MKKWECVICKVELDGDCYHAEPVAEGLCCPKCHALFVIPNVEEKQDLAKVQGQNE